MGVVTKFSINTHSNVPIRAILYLKYEVILVMENQSIVEAEA